MWLKRLFALSFLALACIFGGAASVSASPCTDKGGTCQSGFSCPSGKMWAADSDYSCGATLEHCCVPKLACNQLAEGASCVEGLCPPGTSDAPGLPGTTGCDFGSHCCMPDNKKVGEGTALGQAFNQDAAKNAQELANQKNAFANGLCFLPSECSEVGGTFQANTAECGSGKGKCLAPEPTIRLSSPILGRTTVTGIRQYVDLAFRYLLNAGLIAALVMFVYGGFKYILSASVFEVGSAKETMINSLAGLIILFGTVTILSTINPTLTAYHRTPVYMINKIIFNQAEWCSDYRRPSSQPEILFAFAGDPAGSTKYADASFDKKLPETECGKKYYPQQYGGQFCSGRKCKDKGFACVSCKGNFPECNGNPLGVACVKAAFTGNISWGQFSAPQKIYLLGVCGGAEPSSFAAIDKNVPEYVEGEIVNNSNTEKGSVGYLFTTQLGDYQKARDACGGNFRGFLLGIQYKDSCDSFKAQLKKVQSVTERGAQGAAVGAVAGAGIFSVPTAITTGLAGAAGGYVEGTIKCLGNADDVLIATKRDCAAGGARYFSGYADGASASKDITDMKVALYCGWKKLPAVPANLQPASGNTHLFDASADAGANPYWTYEEIQAAASGDADAITCDLGLNFENASPDPGTNYYGGCDENTK